MAYYSMQHRLCFIGLILADPCSNLMSVALMAYTLSRINSEVASLLLQKLNDRAIVYQGLKYWTGDKDSGSAAEVEVTSYALLAYVSMREISEALPIVKWISVNRNVLGGFR